MIDNNINFVLVGTITALVIIMLLAVLDRDRAAMRDCKARAYPRNAIYVGHTDTCYLVKDDYSLFPLRKEK